MRYLVSVGVGTIWKLRLRRKDIKACQCRHLASQLAYTYHGESVLVAVYDDESLVISVISPQKFPLKALAEIDCETSATCGGG